jgi:hypothetical protein
MNKRGVEEDFFLRSFIMSLHMCHVICCYLHAYMTLLSLKSAQVVAHLLQDPP